MSVFWLLALFAAVIGSAQFLHWWGKRHGEPIVTTATAAIALPDLEPRLVSVAEVGGDESRFAQALREIEQGDADVVTDRIALIMLDVRAGILDDREPEPITPQVPTYPRAFTTINATPEAGRSSSVIPTSAVELAASFRHVAWHAPKSYRDFDAHVELGLLYKALTDPTVADVLAANDPMLGFLLPVRAIGAAPEFAGARDTFEAHSWHTGLTGVMPVIDGEIVGSAA